MDLFNLEPFTLCRSDDCNVCDPSVVEENALDLFVVDASSQLLIIDAATDESESTINFSQAIDTPFVKQELIVSEDSQEHQKRNKKPTNDIPYECQICNKTFTQRSNLWKHVKLHTGETPFQCTTCSKTFTQQANLKRHEQMHTTDQSPLFKCNLCDKSFKQQANLNTHILMHSGSKPFVCDTCYKAFNQKSNLTKHQLIHSNERPFVCDICQAAFNQNNQLKKHKATHSEFRTYYQCEACEKVFLTETGSRMHSKVCKRLKKPQ